MEDKNSERSLEEFRAEIEARNRRINEEYGAGGITLIGIAPRGKKLKQKMKRFQTKINRRIPPQGPALLSGWRENIYSPITETRCYVRQDRLMVEEY